MPAKMDEDPQTHKGYVKDMYVFGGTTLAEKIGSRCGAMTTTDDRRPSIDRAPQVN